MAVINAQSAPVANGLEVVFSNAAALGDEVPVGNGRILIVKNGDASAKTVTVATPGTVKGLDIAEASKAITAGGIWVLPLADEFRNSVGRATVTYSAVTSVTLAVVEPAR